jgi:hypothetical protein
VYKVDTYVPAAVDGSRDEILRCSTMDFIRDPLRQRKNSRRALASYSDHISDTLSRLIRVLSLHQSVFRGNPTPATLWYGYLF